MNFLFTEFLTAKPWLEIFGKAKALSFSKFLYRFTKNAKNWMPSKEQKKNIFWNLDFGPNY